MNATENQLALEFIKAGITPFYLENEPKALIKKKVLAKGFTLEDLEAVMERWDSNGARDAARRRAFRERQKA